MPSTPVDAEDSPPRSALALMRDGRFGRYFAGNLGSNIGTWCHDIAAAIFVFQVTGLASMVALVAVAGFSMSMVFAPIAGALADRFDRRVLLFVSMLVLGGVSAVFAVLLGIGVAEVWLVLVVTGILGAGRGITSTTIQAYLPALVPPRDLAQAAALNSITFNLARVLGPALGALLITLGGPAIAFGANAASFIAFAAILASLKVSMAVKPRPSGGILGGFGYVGRRPRFILLLVLSALIGMATDPVITLGPSFAKQFGQPQEYAGWFVSAFGVGAVLAAPFVGMLRHRVGAMRIAAFGFAGLGCSFAAAALVDSPYFALGWIAIGGFCFLTASADITTTLLEQLDDGVRGRVMAIWTLGFHGARPVAAVIDGGLADAFTPAVAMLAMAGLMLVTFAGMLPLRGWLASPHGKL